MRVRGSVTKRAPEGTRLPPTKRQGPLPIPVICCSLLALLPAMFCLAIHPFVIGLGIDTVHQVLSPPHVIFHYAGSFLHRLCQTMAL